MIINIDLAQLAELTNLGASEVLVRIVFWYFGWLPLAVLFIWGSLQLWLYDRQRKYYNKQKFTILAIDLPQNNLQSPLAVENLFSYLHGAQKLSNLVEKWWEGVFQLPFSLEIISLEGYVQFLIYTPEASRQLVETAVYSQYPDAEITEVEDYTQGATEKFPDEEEDLYGAEIIYSANQAYPIRLYPEFEHQFGPPETTYRDPMASLMDLLSSLKKGEQMWWQIIIKPANFGWEKVLDKEADKIMGKAKASLTVGGWLKIVIEDVVNAFKGEIIEAKKGPDALNMMLLEPRQKRQLEAVRTKQSKLAFETKMRLIYLARKEVMNKPKVVSGFYGYLRQFGANDLNGFMPDIKKTATNTAYFQADKRSDRRKMRIMRGYKARSAWRGRLPYFMTVDELATVWHFPIDASVKAPTLQRAAARRVEPPGLLPVGESRVAAVQEEIFSNDYEITDQTSARPESAADFNAWIKEDEAAGPPDNLPVA